MAFVVSPLYAGGAPVLLSLQDRCFKCCLVMQQTSDVEEDFLAFADLGFVVEVFCLFVDCTVFDEAKTRLGMVNEIAEMNVKVVSLIRLMWMNTWHTSNDRLFVTFSLRKQGTK